MIMHLHFSELNQNAGTLSHVTEDNSTCVTTKLRQNLSHYILKRFFLQFAINDNNNNNNKIIIIIALWTIIGF